MLEIRFHGRGGQGALTAARILASAFWKEKKYSLVLPEFKSERRSAPVAVFLRIDEKPIVLRSKIYAPDHLIVLDPSLLALKQVKVLDGFKSGGFVVISASAESKFLKFPHGCRVGIADANLIARKYSLGNPALPATGTAMLGAFARITGLVSLESVLSAIQESEDIPKKESNISAAREAFEAAKILETDSEQASQEKKNSSAKLAPNGWQELPISTVSLGDTRNNLTGSWRTIRPYYEDKVSPCKDACPLGNEIPHWLSLLKQGKEKEAWEKLIEKNPLPAITGRVCQAFCEKVCNRKEFDQAVSIRDLERYLGDRALAENWRISVGRLAGKFYVAVVGSGPAGLSCAYHLAKRRYRVEIFEELPFLGGMLRAGIPAFRLSKDILTREIDNILRVGVKVRAVGMNVDAAILDDIKYAYDAVFIATGLQKSRKLNILGENNRNVNVLYGLDFLKSVNLGREVALGNKVIIIGGGNTAIDAARTARSLGSKVMIFYRRTKDEMPAIESEVAKALTEGVEIRELVSPVKISGELIECQKMELGSADESGRKRPVPVAGSNFEEKFDTLIVAVGEEKEEIPGIADGGKIFIDKDTGNVPAAINEGRLGALAIEHYLRTGQRTLVGQIQPPIAGFKDINTAYFKRRKKSKVPRLEAKRCFSCGVCDLCGNCWKFCPHESILEKEGKLVIDYDYCKGCGICFQECPRAAISQELEA